MRLIVLVPRTRSSHHIAAGTVANFGFKSGTRIIELLVSFRFRSSQTRVRHNDANLGIRTLACRVRLGRRGDLRRAAPRPSPRSPRSATSGRDGLELAKAIEPNLVLLDVMMSERTEGFFVLQEMRRVQALSQTPVIVMSSIYSDEPAFRVDPEAGWLPANLFLAKPVEPARLLTEVARLTSESASQTSAITADRR